jgi:DNA repair protein RadD
MIKLREYQLAFKANVFDAWSSVRAVLGVLPTGGGKTRTFAAVIHDHDGASAAVVHRKEIVAQISMALADLDVKHRVIADPKVIARIRKKQLDKHGKSYVDPHAQCGVVSVQTLTSPSSKRDAVLQRWVGQVTLAVFDEGHHYVRSGFWGRAVEMFADARLLFVTATPERADGTGLGAETGGGYADVMVEGPSAADLIAAGYLCKFTYKAPLSDLDVSNLPITASGDVNTKAMRARITESHLVGDVVDQYFKFCPGKRALVFANDVQSAREIEAAFIARGVAAKELNGATDGSERDHAIDAFEANRLQVLVNVDLFDEGFDVPGADAAILARVTNSLAKYLQMCGRVLRPVYAKGYDLETVEGRLAAMAASDKPQAIVIDPVGNWQRNGLPNWPRVWTLDSRAKGDRSGPNDMRPQRVCVQCTQPYEAFYKACPYCGHEPQPVERSTPEQVDGDLGDLDVEGMAALLEKIRRATMTDEEYELEQIKRGIPPIGRGADLRRFRAAKHRREVLKELIAWWVGAQTDRPLSEVHRRFYYRFNVDIGTALTLNENETDALIERITKRFSEDLTT